MGKITNRLYHAGFRHAYTNAPAHIPMKIAAIIIGLLYLAIPNCQDMAANPFAQWANAAGNAIGSVLPSRTLNYQRPAPPVIPGVPSQYAPDVESVISRTGMPTTTIAAELNQENGGNWSPTLQGKANPSDYGPAQINTGPTGAAAELQKTPFFQNAYGHPFNVKNPDDNIKGMGVYLNYIRQYLLPSRGVKNPTDAQVIAAYNSLGAPGKAYAQAVQQKANTLSFAGPTQ